MRKGTLPIDVGLQLKKAKLDKIIGCRSSSVPSNKISHTVTNLSFACQGLPVYLIVFISNWLWRLWHLTLFNLRDIGLVWLCLDCWQWFNNINSHPDSTIL